MLPFHLRMTPLALAAVLLAAPALAQDSNAKQASSSSTQSQGAMQSPQSGSQPPEGATHSSQDSMHSSQGAAKSSQGAAQSSQSAEQSQGATQAEYSADTLQSFAAAYREVAIIRDIYTGLLAQAEEPAQIEALQLQARRAMIAAIQSYGIKPEMYTQIARDISQNKQLRQHVVRLAMQQRQQQLQQQPGNGQPKAKSQYSKQELRNFAEAYRRILIIRDIYTGRLAQAETAAQAQALQEQARLAMIAAIQDQGIEPETFNRIAQDLSGDEQLRRRVLLLVAQQQRQRSEQQASSRQEPGSRGKSQHASGQQESESQGKSQRKSQHASASSGQQGMNQSGSNESQGASQQASSQPAPTE